MKKWVRSAITISIVCGGAFFLNAVPVGAIWAEDVRPSSILYISAEPGCYSKTYVSSKTISMAPPKRIFKVSCSSLHHYEVFWAGKFKTRPGNPIPNTKESAKFCLQKSDELKYFSRASNSYNSGPDETIGVGNWLADKGPEASRFPKRLVCYVGLSTKEFRVFKEVNFSLIKDMK